MDLHAFPQFYVFGFVAISGLLKQKKIKFKVYDLLLLYFFFTH